MQLTNNFHLDEFKCKDGSSTPQRLIPSIQHLANQLQVIRDTIDKPIIILSGYRSDEWNKKVGGAKKSLHTKGMAADIKVPGMTPQQLIWVILRLQLDRKIHKGGTKKYASWVHYDIGRERSW